MTELSFPHRKILLPYDGSPWARLALVWAAALSRVGGAAVQGLTLVRVIGGSYLARHLQNVDLRVTRLDREIPWQRLRQRFLEEDIQPMLQEAVAFLQAQGVTCPVTWEIREGKISEQILKLAREGNFTTIIMGRRGLSPWKELLLGSVTRGVLQAASGVTVIIPGQETAAPAVSTIFPLLLPVDGSEASQAAVRQAAAVAAAWTQENPRIEVLHVLDLALLGPALAEEAQTLVQEGENILTAAKAALTAAGLERFCTTKLLTGHPPEVIAREAEDLGAALIYMGSVGRSGLSRLLLGSVTQGVLHLAKTRTIAVYYP